MSSVPPRVRLVEKHSREVYLKENVLRGDMPVPEQEKASGSGGQDKIEIEDEQPGVKPAKGRSWSEDPVALFRANAKGPKNEPKTSDQDRGAEGTVQAQARNEGAGRAAKRFERGFASETAQIAGECPGRCADRVCQDRAGDRTCWQVV